MPFVRAMSLQKCEGMKMNNQNHPEASLINYYEAARESFVAKMKSEDDERSNLKFKIAAFVISELSHATPAWFTDYFLVHIAGQEDCADTVDAHVREVEKAFYDKVADYLLQMELEVDYVKARLTPSTKEHARKDFWQPIVFDAFLIVGIYFNPSLNPCRPEREGREQNPKDTNLSRRRQPRVCNACV